MAEKYILDYSGKEVNDLLKKVENTPEISLDGYATEEYVTTEINKIEIPSIEGLASEIYVNEELAKKANTDDLNGLASENYVEQQVADLVNSAPDTLDTLGEIAKAIQDNEDVVDALNNMIATKADKTEIPSLTGYATENYVNEVVEPKADKNYVNEELNKKANTTDLNGLATESYVNTQVAKKTDTAYVDNAVAPKADKSYVDTELTKKANMTDLNGLATEAYVNTEIAKKTDTNYVNEMVSPKADKTYVDEELNKKANATALNGLASEDYVDQKVADLVNSAPKTLDTLGELANAIQDNQEVIEFLEDKIIDKADKKDIPSLDGYATEEYVHQYAQIVQYDRFPSVGQQDIGQIGQYIGDTTNKYITGGWYKVDWINDYSGNIKFQTGLTINSIDYYTYGPKIKELFPSIDEYSVTKNIFTLECYTVNKNQGLYNFAIKNDSLETKYATNKELGIDLIANDKSYLGCAFTANQTKLTNDFFAGATPGSGDTRARIAETETGYWIGLSWTLNTEGRKYIKVALNDPNDIETDVLWYWHSVNGITYDIPVLELPENFGTFYACPTYDYEQVILDYMSIDCPYVEILHYANSAIGWAINDEPLTKKEVSAMINSAVTEQINSAITGALEGSY